MKIELSPTKIVPGCLTVWHEHQPGVDLVMDLKKLTFAPGSVDELYTFHVLDHLFEAEVLEALTSWKDVLKKGAEMFIVVDDFEYLARAFIGGDIDLKYFNANHAHPTYFRQEDLADALVATNFIAQNVRVWNTPSVFQKQSHELVMSAKKHD